MKTQIIALLLKFVSIETIDKLLVQGVAKLLDIAHRKGGSWWDKCKKVIHHIAVSTALFDRVYDDDAMSAEEEQEIIDAIRTSGLDGKLDTILKKFQDKIKES